MFKHILAAHIESLKFLYFLAKFVIWNKSQISDGRLCTYNVLLHTALTESRRRRQAWMPLCLLCLNGVKMGSMKKQIALLWFLFSPARALAADEGYSARAVGKSIRRPKSQTECEKYPLAQNCSICIPTRELRNDDI